MVKACEQKLFPEEGWLSDFDPAMLENKSKVPEACLRAFVTKTEWLLLTVLLKPESKKFRDNLVKYTASLSEAVYSIAGVVLVDVARPLEPGNHGIELVVRLRKETVGGH